MAQARAITGSAGKLATYKAKRDFDKTPEPNKSRLDKAAWKSTAATFVIQKHFARRLHFDLRLEIDGVLASWAVAKGPSLDPSQRRLAIRTEDHPLAYAQFQGDIPAGEYGAGSVEIWDQGTYEMIGDSSPGDALAAGQLKFMLKGERLTGGYALIRTAPEKGRERWLLIKERDGYVDDAFDPASTWVGPLDSEPVPVGEAGDGPRPHFRKPQLATDVDRPPEGENWIHEIKYDGFRLQAVRDGHRINLYTRRGRDWTAKLPHIRDAIRQLPRQRIVLDGEIVVFDDNGNTNFAALQAALGGTVAPIQYVVFDCLQLGRRDLAARAWRVRNGELSALLAATRPPLRYAESVAGNGPDVFEAAHRLGAEGIISKHVDRPWKSGRNRHWLKCKVKRRKTLLVGGYRTSKARPFASLLVGEKVERELIYRGRVGIGFSDKQLVALRKRLDALATTSPAFRRVPDEARRNVVWLEPSLAVDVTYSEQTSEGHLRHGKFLGIAATKASDKTPRDKSLARGPNAETSGIKLTNTDKLLYRDAGYTKGDLLDYYEAAAPLLLPYIRDRFVSLVRAPNGALDRKFFQRHDFAGRPDAIEIETREGRHKRYLTINTVEGLRAAAQFAVLEIHPWGAKRQTPDFPDRLIFDLDPDEGLPFKTVKSAARLVRDVLSAGGLESFALLTGGKGVHVVAPLDETANWDRVTGFAKTLAQRLAKAKPDMFVASQAKSKRRGRIYLDWQRNKPSSTAIAPWSPRARPGAPVACPVSWEELGRAAAADAYDLDRARRRLSALGSDPWAGYTTCRQTVPEF